MKDVKTYGQLREFLATIIANMPNIPANVMQEWIENPKILKKTLEKALLYWKIWKTIKIGWVANTDSFNKLFFSTGIIASQYAYDILEKITLEPKQTKIDLVVLSPSILGLEKEASREDIYLKALSLGLSICPAEVGPQLVLELNTDRIKKEVSLNIAMLPISDSDAGSRLFSVEYKDGKMWLVTNSGNPECLWDSDDLFVFVLPRK